MSRRGRAPVRGSAASDRGASQSTNAGQPAPESARLHVCLLPRVRASPDQRQRHPGPRQSGEREGPGLWPCVGQNEARRKEQECVAAAAIRLTEHHHSGLFYL